MRKNHKLERHADFKSAFAALIILAFLAQGATAQAQGTVPSSSSYITPFPQNDKYQTHVLGDWLAIGLSSGLEEAFRQEGTLEIVNSSRSSAGLTRADGATEMLAEIDRLLGAGPIHIAVLFMGVNDGRSIRDSDARDGRARLGTPEWKTAYAKEAEKIIKKLRAANVAVYWVGLPVMSTTNPSLSQAVEGINDAVREATYLNGAKYIDTWAGFADQFGKYTPYGPDLTGQSKRLREGDGIGFTAAGNRKLAYYAETVIKRDLAAARSQRNIPLAGDQEEQARVVPSYAKPSSQSASQQGGGPGLSAVNPPDFGAARGIRPDGNLPDVASGDGPERPQIAGLPPVSRALPPPALEAARQDQAAFSSGGITGDLVLSELSQGLTAIAVVSPLNDVSLRDAQRRIPLSERLYFRVLSKGEALPSKEGRADDFTWDDKGKTETAKTE